MRTTLYIGGWRVDQFSDEAATVVSSVLDITDITKNTGDYTKTFTVPQVNVITFFLNIGMMPILTTDSMHV